MNALPSLLAGPHDAEQRPDAPAVLSVCSSVGGLDLGLHRAGLRHAGFCEFEERRVRTLRRHWGEGIEVWPDLLALADECERDPGGVLGRLGGRPRVLAGGTPCQDLSSAGQRAGLEGGRSSLFWAFVRVRNALGIEWALWENVAGAYTSNGGLDFMAVLGAFVGADVTFRTERGRRIVPRAGLAAGPWGGCGWRQLNAQFFGVAQRRRRVFVVARLGAECPPEVLFDPAGGGRDLGQERAQRTGAPWAAAARASIDGGAELARARRDGRGAGGGGVDRADDLGQPVAGTLGSNRTGGHRLDLDGSGAYVAGALDRGKSGADDNAARASHVVGAGVTPGFGDTAATLTSGSSSPGVSKPGRRREDDVNIVAAKRPDEPEAPDADGVREADGLAGRVDDARAVPEAEARPGEAEQVEGEAALEVDAFAGQGDHVAERGDVAPPVTRSKGQPGTVGMRLSGKGARGEVLDETDVADTLDVVGPHPSLNQGVTVVGLSSRGREGGGTLEENEGEVSSSLRGSSGGGSRVMAYVKRHGAADPTDDERWAEGEVARSINAADAARQDGGPALVSSPTVLDTYNQSEVEGGVTNTLARAPQTALMAPGEGECLEGDACAWDPAPDSYRYEACGDGVAAPCSHWIGLRLVAVMEGRDPDG